MSCGNNWVCGFHYVTPERQAMDDLTNYNEMQQKHK